jgi:hypothetical protein
MENHHNENISGDHENISNDHENITSDRENILELFKFRILQNKNWIHSICLFIDIKTSWVTNFSEVTSFTDFPEAFINNPLGLPVILPKSAVT